MAVQIEYKVDTKEVEKAKEELKSLSKETEDVQRDAGGLGTAFGSLGDQLQSFSNRVNVAGVGLGDLGGKASGSVKGLKGLTTGFKALDLVLKASVIGLIVVAVAALGTNLVKTSKGAEFLRKAMATLEGVFNGVVDVLINLDKIFSRNIIDVFDKNIKQAKTLAALQRDVARANRILSGELATANVELERLNTLADDATLSLKAQQEAAQAAAQAELEAAGKREDIAKNNALLIKAEISTLKARNELVTEDLKDQLNEAEIAVKEAQAETLRVTLENATRVRQIDQDTFEQRLDFLIDYTDNQKAINERLIADDTKTIEERRAILQETQDFTDAAFQKAFKSFEDQAGQRLDINMLLKESDADVVFGYLRGTELSEIETTRLLEFLRERKTFTQDLADAEMELNDKALARDQAQRDEIKDRNQRDFEARVELAILRQDDEVKREIARRNLLLLETDLTESERRLIIEQSEKSITEIKKAEEEKRQEANAKVAEDQAQNLQSLGTVAEGFGAAGVAFNKSVAVKDATISTYQGANKALAAFPPPFNFIAAAAVVAAGLANVGQIVNSSTSLPSFNVPDFKKTQKRKLYRGGLNIEGADGIDRIPAMLTRGESVLTQTETRKFYPTLKAIRTNKIDPDLLNGFVLGDPRVIDASKVIEIPRDSITMDENGFSKRTVQNGQMITRKQNRYSWGT